eukprot:gb/GECG01009418.1/.p1 GENE.gb/GECG01009418.1/~~gb/GECG01009418.1/.p1  ORF type:complete len:114 (+),score=12.20 gb/GECG01009418.1/:1-342(+)
MGVAHTKSAIYLAQVEEGFFILLSVGIVRQRLRMIQHTVQRLSVNSLNSAENVRLRFGSADTARIFHSNLGETKTIRCDNVSPERSARVIDANAIGFHLQLQLQLQLNNSEAP